MYYANENFLSNKLIVANNIKKNDMFNIEAMESRFHSHSKKQFNFAYAYSEILVRDIIEMYSEEVIIGILKNIKYGDEFEDAFYKNILLSNLYLLDKLFSLSL